MATTPTNKQTSLAANAAKAASNNSHDVRVGVIVLFLSLQRATSHTRALTAANLRPRASEVGGGGGSGAAPFSPTRMRLRAYGRFSRHNQLSLEIIRYSCEDATFVTVSSRTSNSY